MGVIYKIKQEIKEYILEAKKNNANLSCRDLVPLLENRFQIKVSKSSINAIFKEAGLSKSIGRRLKPRRKVLGKTILDMEKEAQSNLNLSSGNETPLENNEEITHQISASSQDIDKQELTDETDKQIDQKQPDLKKLVESLENTGESISKPPLEPESSIKPEILPSKEEIPLEKQEKTENTQEESSVEQTSKQEPSAIEEKPLEEKAIPEETGQAQVTPSETQKTEDITFSESAAPQEEQPEQPLPKEEDSEKTQQAPQPESPSNVPINASEEKIPSAEPVTPEETQTPPLPSELQEEQQPLPKEEVTEQPVSSSEKTQEDFPAEAPVPIPSEPQQEQQPPATSKEEVTEQPVLSSEKAEEDIPAQQEIPAMAGPVSDKISSEVQESFEISPEAWEGKETTGAIFLKAADSLLGGTSYIAETIRKLTGVEEKVLISGLENLIYSPLFTDLGEGADLSVLWSLTKLKLTKQQMQGYLNKLQGIKELVPNLFLHLSSITSEIRAIEITLSDGNIQYLDGQLHTIWSSPYIPYDFAATSFGIKHYLGKYFSENYPFVFFIAPGYEAPSKEFFHFILHLDSVRKGISRLGLYSNKLERLDNFEAKNVQRQYFVFGLWPWQFIQNRRVKKIGDFKAFYIEKLNRDFYLAEIEMELTQPVTKQYIILKGCALKTSLTEKTRLVILSNLSFESNKLNELFSLYFERWPNLEEGFKDYSRKIELFTYTATSQRFFSMDSISMEGSQEGDCKNILAYYLKVLDLYVKARFLPYGYEDKDFPTIKERFYDLKVSLEEKKDCVMARFSPPADYKFASDLEYACRRVNEREVMLADGRRLFLNLGI